MLAHFLLPCGYRVDSHLMELRWHGLGSRIDPLTRRAARAPLLCARGRCGRPAMEGVALRAQPGDAPQACGVTAFESYASMTCSPPPVAVTHEQHAPTQSGGGTGLRRSRCHRAEAP